jgi:hypothetical protein
MGKALKKEVAFSYRVAFEMLQLVLEPGGAAGLAVSELNHGIVVCSVPFPSVRLCCMLESSAGVYYAKTETIEIRMDIYYTKREMILIYSDWNETN